MNKDDTRMKSLVVEQPGKARLEDMPIPQCGPQDVLIRVHASGICGTDVHIYRGEYLGDYPIVPGHESAGVVDSVGSDVSEFQTGDDVAFEPNISCGFCRACLEHRENFCERWQGIGVTRPGSMAEYVVVPQQNVFPTTGLPAETACFMEPLSCVLHGIERARLKLADRILVLGAGPIGTLLLQTARAQGVAAATVLERNDSRLKLAEEHGADRLVRTFDELSPDSFDVVIDATGSIEVLERAIEFVRYGGTMLFFGVAPRGEQMRIEPFQIFRKGLTIVSSYTSLRNSYQAIGMLKSGVVKVASLVSHRLALDEFAHGIELIESGADDVRKVVILPYE